MTHPLSEDLRLMTPFVATDRNYLDAAADELDRLHAIVERLPKTADGAPIAPGILVYTLDDIDDPTLVTGVSNYNACDCDGDGEESYHGAQDDCQPDCDRNHDAKQCYSTREAALAAKEARNERV